MRARAERKHKKDDKSAAVETQGILYLQGFRILRKEL